MSRQWWLLLDGDEPRGQVVTDGRAPSETGDNPHGWEEVRIPRKGDLLRQRFNRQTGRWNRDADREAAAQARQRAGFLARFTEEELDALAEAVAERLKGRGE